MKKFHRFIIICLLSIFLFPAMVNASAFTDVSEKEWFYPILLSNQKNEIIKGYPDGTFRPHQPISRAQVAKVIYSILDLPDVGDYEVMYQDVPKDHSSYKEIVALTKAGIFKNGPFFNPNEPLTRAQIAKIIVLMYDFPVEAGVKVPFQDVPNDNWAKPYIAFLAKTGITTGVTKTKYAPNNTVTRVQTLVLLDRAAKYKKNPTATQTIYDPYKKEYITIKQANPKFVSETIQLVNAERVKKGLSILQEDVSLSQISYIKAQDMVDNHYFDHISPGYGSPWDMAEGFGYFYKTFGENIAHGYDSSSSVVTAWMNSPGHRANILNSKYTKIGVGIALDKDNQYYFVHMFSSK